MAAIGHREYAVEACPTKGRIFDGGKSRVGKISASLPAMPATVPAKLAELSKSLAVNTGGASIAWLRTMS